ncbi:Outer membrane protein (porin) [Nitrosomonas aestuarii]|uniref:Outer membrane protein (Porin) n=1 Tax=Nitrosomonas aestuarii TaxID=52441 RepID=A0A1I3WZN1_9PROT|nr:porin [Nitrosomonas aestuarii]SFK12367.1 Outer membrane protein (porin) [Nitrosomonas aestuarii]
MKKKLISLAVAGALATPMVASAQGTSVTMFGSAQAEYSTVDFDGLTSQAQIGDETGRSRWGVHVIEQLGGGLKAKAHLEFGFNTGNGDLGVARERWVALANDAWGEVKFGRVQSPFKDFAGGQTIDPFAYTSLQAAGSGGTMTASANGMGSGAQGFVNSAARYDSPTVEGFSFAALLMPGDSNNLDPILGGGIPNSNNLTSSSTSGGEDGEWDFQIAGKYEANIADHNVGVFGGYSRDNISTNQRAFQGVGADDEEIWRGGASWSFQNFRISGQYENVNNASINGAASCTTAAALGATAAGGANNGAGRGQCNSAMNVNGDGHLWFVGGEYALGNTRLLAQGGMSEADATTAAVKREMSTFTVGAIHNLSKRSSLFGGYQRNMIDNSTASGFRDSNVYTVGMRHDF